MGHPAQVAAAMLGGTVDNHFIRKVFDHKVELNWNGSGGNQDVELLGKFLAGKDPLRMMEVSDPARLAVGDSDIETKGLYVHDTTGPTKRDTPVLPEKGRSALHCKQCASHHRNVPHFVEHCYMTTCPI
jgi:hypothetical protein